LEAFQRNDIPDTITKIDPIQLLSIVKMTSVVDLSTHNKVLAEKYRISSALQKLQEVSRKGLIAILHTSVG
jgi:ACT domain-containing protein